MTDWIQYTGDSLFDEIIDCFVALYNPIPGDVNNPRIGQIFNCRFSLYDEKYDVGAYCDEVKFIPDFFIMFSVSTRYGIKHMTYGVLKKLSEQLDLSYLALQEVIRESLVHNNKCTECSVFACDKHSDNRKQAALVINEIRKQIF